MKKISIVTSLCTISLILLGGCAQNTASHASSKLSSEVSTSRTSKSSTPKSINKLSTSKTTNETIKTSTNSALDNTTKVTVPSTTTPPPAKTSIQAPPISYPYSVVLSPNKVPIIFKFRGFNVPNSITFNDASMTAITVLAKDGTSENFNAINTSIPTRQIRVFSAKNNQIRTISVNTQITLEGNYPDNLASSGPLYLFYNRDGGISLATPNYAGNVSDDQRDVMLEVVQ